MAAVKSKRIFARQLAYVLWALLVLNLSCVATTISTQWGGLTESVAGSIESYIKSHNGALPPDLDSLFEGSIRATLEEQLGGPISSKIIYLKDNLPKLDGSDNSQIVAMISFPINEDRRDSLGRYIIYKRKDGEIGSRWEAEEVIRSSLAKSNIVIPPAPVYHEKPLKVFDPDYAARLVEDAILNHNLSAQDAVEAVNKHLSDVVNGRAKMAKTWAEVASGQTRATPQTTATPPQATPSPSTPKITSPVPTATVAAAETKQSPSPSFPIVPVVILAAVIVGVVVFLFKRKGL